MPESVYIHIPFCTHICYYCDFNKVFLKGQPVDDYLQAMRLEMEHTFQQFPPKQIKTIFIGGGEPQRQRKSTDLFNEIDSCFCSV